jgi:hypothetical protein
MASSGRGEAFVAAVTVSSRMSANTVRKPSPTSACAMARPMPLPAPVTRAASRDGSNGLSRMPMFFGHSVRFSVKVKEYQKGDRPAFR